MPDYVDKTNHYLFNKWYNELKKSPKPESLGGIWVDRTDRPSSTTYQQ